MLYRVTRWLLYPLAVLYGIGLGIAKTAYRWGFRKTHYFNNLYSIVIGNLSVGGTGKTPHSIFFAKKISEKFSLAILSRGYGRQKRGIQEVSIKSVATEVGDEPLLFKQAFPPLSVWVAERRAEAIPIITKKQPETKVVLLDDALQHWALQTDYKILLTAHHRPFFEDYLLPMGRLREPRSGYKRADIIIVSQCPSGFSEKERVYFLQKISPLAHQSVFFSAYRYGNLYALLQPDLQRSLQDFSGYTFIIYTAIAQTDYLEQYLQTQPIPLRWLRHPDHHIFAETDMLRLQQVFGESPKEQTIILTTEKDATRLLQWNDFITKNKLPIFVLPIEIEILFGQELELIHKVLNSIIDTFRQTA